jgi:hypothetical protein
MRGWGRYFAHSIFYFIVSQQRRKGKEGEVVGEWIKRLEWVWTWWWEGLMFPKEDISPPVSLST